jgi:hypothetical protein
LKTNDRLAGEVIRNCKDAARWSHLVVQQKPFQIDLDKLQEDFDMMDENELLDLSGDGDAMFEIEDSQDCDFGPDMLASTHLM